MLIGIYLLGGHKRWGLILGSSIGAAVVVLVIMAALFVGIFVFICHRRKSKSGKSPFF